MHVRIVCKCAGSDWLLWRCVSVLAYESRYWPKEDCRSRVMPFSQHDSQIDLAREVFVPGVEFRHVKTADSHDFTGPQSQLLFFGSQWGVFVVTMRGSDDLFNSICIDNRESEDFVYHLSEPYTMKFSKEPLKLCIRYYASYQEMTDLHRVVRHTSMNGLEKKRKRPCRRELREWKRLAEVNLSKYLMCIWSL